LITDFFTLKKAAGKNDKDLTEVRLAILFDSSSQFFHQAIKGYGKLTGLNYEIYESDYNQVEKEILTGNSKLYQSDPDFIIIGYSTQKLYQKFFVTKDRVSFADQMLEKFKDLCETLCSRKKTNIIFFNFTEGLPSVFGNFSNKIPDSFLYQVRKINFELMNFASSRNNFFILDINLLQHIHGEDFVTDPKLLTNSDISFSLKILPYIAKNVNDIILSFKGKSKKCLILDLDNTLWGGVIGDDGVENIQIGSLGIGKAFTLFQMWIKQLKERGILLVVCSKNNEELAKEPFISHPDMILKMEDFVLFVANWKNKNENIHFIQQTLNIGFDSFVFIDDNPVEREIIRKQYPDITVPELPEDPSEFLPYLSKLNLFETISFTDEDLARTKLYQEESNRVLLKQNYLNEDEFLENLKMYSRIENLNKFNLPRINQLFTRTNQFNLRTKRYTLTELEEISSSTEYISFAVYLKDKYGDYGLISVVILKKEKTFLFIDNWVMSCRVFNRGLEKFIFNHILKISRECGFTLLTGEYIPTAKNKVVADLFKNLGFREKENYWEIDPVNTSSIKNQINYE
jgi:FkbH-like protein